jgi:putative ABC transport system ATP-binding protein
LLLHEGEVILDVHGEQRRGLKVEDLLQMFEKVRGERVTDDTLLLG